MLKKGPLLSAVLPVLLIFATAGASSAGVPDLLKQAEGYTKAGDYAQAEQIYLQILTDFPGTDYAFQAQENLTCLYVTSGKEPEAEAALQELIASFSNHRDIAQTVHDIAYHYRCSQKDEKGNQIDQYVIDNWPASDYAVLGQMDMAKYYVDQGDDLNAEAAFDKLLANYSEHTLIARAVHDVAQHYRFSGKYEKANLLYKYVIDHWPGAEHAMWAQADLIKSYLSLGDDPAAEAAVEKLLTNFNDQPLIARAVWDTGQFYRGLKKYEKANHLYQHVVAHRPDREHAMWAQADLIKSLLALGDDLAAEAAVEKLLTEFSSHKNIARAIHDTAYEYRKLARFDKADQLDQYVIDNWPGDEQTMWAKMDMAKTDIVLGDDAAAQTTIDILIADFNDHPELPTAIFMLAEEYYNQAFRLENEGLSSNAKDSFRKAQIIWERIIMELPPYATYTPHSYYFSACCYRRLGEYEKAIEYFEKVVSNWPHYQYAWSAQCLIGECYEKLQKSRALLETEAYPKIKQAYQAVIEKYPDCSLVELASLKLAYLNLDKGNWAEAAEYFELFLDTDQGRTPTRAIAVLYDLGRAYEQAGQLDKAIERYVMFVELADPSDQRVEDLRARLQDLGGPSK